jgi:hypothetical protein
MNADENRRQETGDRRQETGDRRRNSEGENGIRIKIKRKKRSEVGNRGEQIKIGIMSNPGKGEIGSQGAAGRAGLAPIRDKESRKQGSLRSGDTNGHRSEATDERG